MTRRQRILAAAEAGRISFYVDATHEEVNFRKGHPYTIEFRNGVCGGCVADATRELDPPAARCCRADARYRAATVDEVAAFIGAEPT